MEVEVRLYGSLRRYRPSEVAGAPHHPFHIELPQDTTVQRLTAALGLPDVMVSAAAVNGTAVAFDYLLQSGDSVALIPPAAGGSC